MNDYYNLLSGVCVKPPGSKSKTVSYKDKFGYPVYDEETFKPLTQKAKSIINGISLFERLDLNKYVPLREHGGTIIVSCKMMELIQNPIDIVLLPEKIWTLSSEIFARPCPLKPRHGFVDSRIISSPKELEDLLELVKQEDPKGEIVLTPFVNADYNAILCSSGILSIGPGHDGATGGIKSISFPVAPVKISNDVRFKSGLSSKSTVFIEAVYKKSDKRSDSHGQLDKSFYITQLRGGPKVDQVNDFIPAKMIVKNIVKPHDDLLKWESDVRKFKPGTVVYGKGHTLTSHAAIHCVINKVPFITTFEPKLNQSISPSDLKAVVFDKQKFLQGAHVGLFSNLNKRTMLYFAVSVLHNWSYLSTSEHASWLLGISAVYISKILCALSLGEYRHCLIKPLKIKGVRMSASRGSIYSLILDTGQLNSYIGKLIKVKKEFLMKSKFRRGFGGKHWSEACGYCINIWNTIVEIQNGKKVSPAKINKLVSLINKSVNLVHNNGLLFNKIADSSSIEKIASRPGLAAFELGDIYYNLHTELLKVKKIKTLTAAKEV
jgi:hypothetical protein